MIQTRSALFVTLAAAAFLMVTMGVRQAFGLFISPLNTTTGLGIATISFALAIGQFTWGAVQPIAGALADRYGPDKVLIAGPAHSRLRHGARRRSWTRASASSSRSACSPRSARARQLLGADRRRVEAPAGEARGKAAGIVNAGGSLGQFVFAPVAQALIQALGWMAALWSPRGDDACCAAAGARRGAARGARAPRSPAAGDSPWRRSASVQGRSYVLLNLGFFTCGFHIAFSVTHLPQEGEPVRPAATVASWSLAIIGLANIAGSLAAGFATAATAASTSSRGCTVRARC
jgi:MFS family permease